MDAPALIEEEFQVNPMLISNWELEFNIDLTQAGLKETIEKSVAETEEDGWHLRKTTDLIKVWTKARGSDINQNIPVLRVEH